MGLMLRRAVLLALCCLAGNSWAQTDGKATVSGYIHDRASGESVIGATVVLRSATLGANAQVYGVYSNDYGFFSITLPVDKYQLAITYLGYQNLEQVIDLNDGNLRLDLQLVEEGVSTDEVVVTADREDGNVRDVVVGRNQLDMSQLQKLPALLGEVDVIKTIQLLPGIQFAGEGNSGFFVRGGNFDQNLIQLDEAPVYNSSHLLGFFSVFNADALKDVEVYKAGLPARYGGRLSSVVDIRMKEGNNQRLAGKAGIGIISSRATLEGPIVRDKGSFIVSARRTYADLFLQLSADPEQRENTLYFYDFNAKLNYKLGENDRVFLSGYFGRDVFKFGDQFGFDWGNRTATARWNHVFSDRIFSNVTFIYSDFDYAINFTVTENSGAKISAGIRDWTGKADFTSFFTPKFKGYFGVASTYHTFKTGSLTPTGSESFFEPNILNPQQALESAVYADFEQEISKRISFRYGLRWSNFSVFGPGNTYTYDQEEYNDPLVGSPTPLDTTTYGKGDLIKSYNGLEPRAALRFLINDKSSIKASYDRTYQYIQVASNATASLPTDIWIPASQSVQPQLSDQLSLGYYRNLRNNTYEVSFETYYKRFYQQLDLKDGADIFINRQLETQLRQGNAWSYGAEFFVQKKKGDLTGWVSYTLSKTERKINGINSGQLYPAKNDRRHNISFVSNYDINKRWNVSLTWVYLTGQAVTFPEGKYYFEGKPVEIYSSRNAYRLPAYHRMDLSAVLKGKRNDERKWKTEWAFSVYNAYWRKNAYFIDFRQNEDRPNETEAVKVYLFGIVPSITYNISF